MPFKNIEDRRKYAREYTTKKRRERGIQARTKMSEEERVAAQRKASRKHYYSHIKQERMRIKKWKKVNPEHDRHMSSNKASRKRGGKGTVKYSEWVALKAKFNHTCPACGKKEPEIKLTRDHIKPIKHGGLNIIANIQPLCFACNSTKKDRHIKYKPLI